MRSKFHRSDTQIIGLNETAINDRPAYRAQYKDPFFSTLQYFLVDNDGYTGYMIEYEISSEGFSKYLPIFERMANSFQITK